ncbi:uncharacterized protein LOC135959159 isoform X2 [Calliphora vicina]|uniref:uncharacterized protein LOC135959159 isoform X2 n=1 Tax=Calliphora vicina TaxID=7373 RepID=UPI00325C0A8C
MNFKMALLFSVFVYLTPLEVWSLKRIKRNSLKDATNSRVKQDFVALHNGKPNSEEIDNKTDHKGTSSSSSKNLTSELNKKRNISRPLAVILRERERKFNERQIADHKVTGLTNTSPDSKLVNQAIDNNLDQSVMDKRCDDQEHSKETHKHARNKHLPPMLHTRVVGAHVIMPPQPIQSSYGLLNPIASLDELVKFGNMMMFKVGMDSLPYISQTSQQSYSPNLQQQRHFYRQTNEPNFDYVFNSIEGPQEGDHKDETAIISNPTIFFKTPDSDSESEPKQMASLMQSALDTLLSNSDKNENEIELKCPIHVEKKNANEDGVIQVCSCRFIKTDKQK